MATYTGRVIGLSGSVLAEFQGCTVHSVINQIDKGPYASSNAVIRYTHTSDGSYHGDGLGRVEAIKENGKWVRF